MGKRPSPRETTARAHAAFEAGDDQRAVSLYRTLLRGQPRNDGLLHRLGVCYGRLGRADLAREHLRRAIAVRPTVTRYCDLATALQGLGRFGEARAACEAARRLGPDEPAVLIATANLLNFQGETVLALETLKPAVDRGAVSGPLAVAFARTCGHLKRPGEALPVLDACLGRADIPPPERGHLLFARAEALDGLERYDEAFAAYRQANEIRAARVNFDPETHARTVERILATWTVEAFRAAPRSGAGNDQAVFIVGMPRSGTSLLEQMLAAHPQVCGGGELGGIIRVAEDFTQQAAARGDAVDMIPVLTARGLGAAARGYLRELSAAGGPAPRITDKMTLNFMFLGLIALLLPRSRVIHCVRDPLDTCLSCYLQDFATPMPFAWNLEHLGAYHRAAVRLMAHWKSVVDVPVVDVVYEDLVAGPEPVLRRVHEALDLDWNDACLRFHESARVARTASVQQVRQPLYRTSVGRSRRYERHLGPLRRALGIEPAAS